jgi:hypothetical protein
MLATCVSLTTFATTIREHHGTAYTFDTYVDWSVEVRAACHACQNVPLREDSALAGTESSENHAFDPLP